MITISASLSLREFHANDALELAQVFNNPRIHANLTDRIPFPYTEKDAVEFIHFANSAHPVTQFAIICEGQLAGGAGLQLGTGIYALSAELGYWIAETHWGKGIATDVARALSTHGFENLSLQRIFAKVYAHNTASMRVLEKTGFRKEGIFRQSVLKSGKLMDEHCYALLSNQTTNHFI